MTIPIVSRNIDDVIKKIQSYRKVSALKKMLKASLKEKELKKIINMIPNNNKLFNKIKELLNDFEIRENILNDIVEKTSSCVQSCNRSPNNYSVYETPRGSVIKYSTKKSTKSSTKKSTKRSTKKSTKRSTKKSTRSKKGGFRSIFLMLLIVVFAYMYGYQQGVTDGSEQTNRRERARRDVELWTEMENLLRYPPPSVERRCMEIVSRRNDVTITRTTGNNRMRLADNNNNNLGSGIKRRRNRKKPNRAGVVSWAWLDNKQTRSLRKMAKEKKRSKKQTQRRLSKKKMKAIEKALAQRYKYFQNNRIRDIKPTLSIINSLGKSK